MEKIKFNIDSFKKGFKRFVELNKIQTPKIDATMGVAIRASIMTVLVLAILGGGLVYANRGKVFNYFAAQALKDRQSALSSDSNSKNPRAYVNTPLLSQESLVVDTVKQVKPAVVSIIISKDVPKYITVPGSGGANPFGGIFGNDPFFNQFFNAPQLQQNGTEKKEIGGGSGFLVSSNGLIVTNKHVVEDKTAEYTVFTNDGKKHAATVIARDPVLDVAVIKIEGAGYPYLSFGDSNKLNVGQTVIAIGNALGEFKNTVSVGVVSGLSRKITAGDASGKSELLSNVIQTDAAINPGNSGGPLLDLNGMVIGVNVAVAQGSQNIGFALPADSIKSVVDSVKSTGKIIRPYVGIRYVPVTAELKDRNNLSVDYGILVSRGATSSDLAVIPGSPADKAGIVENDIILSVDGVKIDAEHDFASVIRGKSVGSTVSLEVLHKGTNETLALTLTEAPQS